MGYRVYVFFLTYHQVIGVCEPREFYRNRTADLHEIPAENAFSGTCLDSHNMCTCPHLVMKRYVHLVYSKNRF